MRIAINTLSPHSIPAGGNAGYVTRLFFLLAAQFHQHQFIFLSEKPFDHLLSLPANVTAVIIPRGARHTFPLRWWLDLKVAMALRRCKADVFISCDACSLTTRLPQVLIINDLNFLYYPQQLSRLQSFMIKTYLPKYLQKAKMIATLSDAIKVEIATRYNIPAGKVVNISGAATQMTAPIEWEEKEQVKEKYAEGCEYFVFVGGFHPRKNLLNLLKAYSLFKKRQHTNMKLLVVGNLIWDRKSTLEKLETYKFRNAVKLLDYLPIDEYAKVIAGAYALVFPSFSEGFPSPVLEAMQSNVAVITTHQGSMAEIGGDAVLYADPNDPAAIADQLKLLFKDENLRSKLIENGALNAAQYTWQRSAERLWSAIEQAVSK